MSFPRVVATFNIKDPDDQKIYAEITNLSRGLLSEVCCAALRQWKGTNLNAEEIKAKLIEIDKEKAELNLKEQSLLNRLNDLKQIQITKQKSEIDSGSASGQETLMAEGELGLSQAGLSGSSKASRLAQEQLKDKLMKRIDTWLVTFCGFDSYNQADKMRILSLKEAFYEHYLSAPHESKADKNMVKLNMDFMLKHALRFTPRALTSNALKNYSIPEDLLPLKKESLL